MNNADFLFETRSEERAFNKRYSRFKVVFYFKNGPMRGKPVTYYGKEKFGISVLQINHGHYKQIVLDRAAGLRHCYDLIAHYAGKYQTAIIFDRKKNTTKDGGITEIGREVAKYVNDALAEEESCIIAPGEERIICNVLHNNKQWILQKAQQLPDPATIDFKTEIHNALYKQS